MNMQSCAKGKEARVKAGDFTRNAAHCWSLLLVVGALPPAEGLPQDPAAPGARAGEEVQRPGRGHRRQQAHPAASPQRQDCRSPPQPHPHRGEQQRRLQGGINVALQHPLRGGGEEGEGQLRLAAAQAAASPAWQQHSIQASWKALGYGGRHGSPARQHPHGRLLDTRHARGPGRASTRVRLVSRRRTIAVSSLECRVVDSAPASSEVALLLGGVA